jgi:PAS domain S-box-containing protein
MKKLFPLAIIILTTALVALFDLWTSAELVGSILFTFPLALCATQNSKRVLWSTTAATVLLTVAAEFVGFHRTALSNPWDASINRCLLIVTFLVLATLIHFWINRSQKIVMDAAQMQRQSSSLTAQNRQLETPAATAALDIRERKETEARYRGLLEAAPDAMVVVNHLGEIVLLNLQAEKQFGYRRDELLGQKIKNIIPQGFAERLIADGTRTAAEALAQQIGTGIELVGQRKDASEFPIEIMLSPLESAEGILVTAAIRDISLRKASEKHLVQMEDRYRGLLEAAPDAMVVADAQGRIIFINAETERLFGYPRNELLGQQVEILVPGQFREMHPQHRQGYTAHLRLRPMRDGLELRGLRKDNTEFPAEISLSPLESSEGILVTAAIRDISQRKQAEETLRQSEERLTLLVQGVKDYSILMLDPDGRVTTWNKGAELITGYRDQEIIGAHFSKFYIPEAVERDKPSEDLKIAVEQGCFEGEGWRVRKDGSQFWANVVITALRGKNGQLRGFSKITRDITARKEAEEALRTSEETVRMTVEAADMGTWFYDIQRNEISWSEKFRALFGLISNDKITYEEILLVIHPDDRQRLDQSVKTTLECGTPYDIEYRVVWPDSSDHWIAAKGRAYRSAEGVPVYMQGIAMDITERKKSEDYLMKTVGELKRSNDELVQFAYVASHDLQEPLRMVASYTQLLAKRYKGRLDSDADEFIAYAVDGSNRMQGMIQDLLAYSRAGSNGKVLLGISTENAFENALTNLGATITDSGAIVTHDPLPTITSDETQLTQVFQNLVGNAIKYRGFDVPQVHVSASKNGRNEWIFSVRDNGLGIDSQYFDRIFIIFQRLHGREERKGTGIGLAICKKILERLGGRIWVESQLEKGSTFYFALPQGVVN